MTIFIYYCMMLFYFQESRNYSKKCDYIRIKILIALEILALKKLLLSVYGRFAKIKPVLFVNSIYKFTKDPKLFLRFYRFSNPVVELIAKYMSSIRVFNIEEHSFVILLLSGLLKNLNFISNFSAFHIDKIYPFRLCLKIIQKTLNEICLRIKNVSEIKKFTWYMYSAMKYSIKNELTKGEGSYLSKLSLAIGIILLKKKSFPKIKIYYKQSGLLKESFLDQGLIILKSKITNMTTILESPRTLNMNLNSKASSSYIKEKMVTKSVEINNFFTNDHRFRKIFQIGVNFIFSNKLVRIEDKIILNYGNIEYIDNLDTKSFINIAHNLSFNPNDYIFNNIEKLRVSQLRFIYLSKLSKDKIIIFNKVDNLKGTTLVISASNNFNGQYLKNLILKGILLFLRCNADYRFLCRGGNTEIKMVIKFISEAKRFTNNISSVLNAIGKSFEELYKEYLKRNELKVQTIIKSFYWKICNNFTSLIGFDVLFKLFLRMDLIGNVQPVYIFEYV